MIDVLPLIILVLSIFAILGAVLFLSRAWGNRTTSVQAPFNVGQHQARMAMRINVIRAFAVLIFGVILLGVFLLMRVNQAGSESLLDVLTPQSSPTAPIELSPTQTVPVVEPQPPTPVPVVTQAVPVLPSSTPIVEDTPTSAPLPTNTAVPEPETAVVSSGVGVWLRATPSTDGEQLEWLLQGVELILLEGQSTGETFTWQQVQAPSGTVGWVAIDFIQIADS